MPAKKAATTNNKPETNMQVLKEDTCSTSSGKSTLGYQVGVDDSGEIHLKIASNTGGGFFSAEWIAHRDIQKTLQAWPADQSITSLTLRPLYRGKSVNTPGFLIAVLTAERLLEPVPGKSRVFQPCDPAGFLASVAALQGSDSTAAKERKPRAKVSPKAKAKTAPRRVSTPNRLVQIWWVLCEAVGVNWQMIDVAAP